jgi:hypothetical protein
MVVNGMIVYISPENIIGGKNNWLGFRKNIFAVEKHN